MKIILVLVVILIILLITCNKKEYVFYGKESCPYCVKMKESLNMSKFRYVDITTPKGKTEFMKYEVSVVPLFVNRKNGKTVSGSMEPSKLYKELDNNTNYLILGSNSCGYTIKLKDELRNKKVYDQFVYVDVKSPKGRVMYDSLKHKAVPYVISLKTGKSSIGYKKFEDLQKELS